MEPVKISQIALVLKCPRCQSTQLEQPPQFVAAINPLRGSAPQPSAANPDSNIRCVECNSRWHESDVDVAGARYAELRKAYSPGAQT
jgi:hypothetical protein